MSGTNHDERPCNRRKQVYYGYTFTIDNLVCEYGKPRFVVLQILADPFDGDVIIGLTRVSLITLIMGL